MLRALSAVSQREIRQSRREAGDFRLQLHVGQVLEEPRYIATPADERLAEVRIRGGVKARELLEVGAKLPQPPLYLHGLAKVGVADANQRGDAADRECVLGIFRPASSLLIAEIA